MFSCCEPETNRIKVSQILSVSYRTFKVLNDSNLGTNIYVIWFTKQCLSSNIYIMICIAYTLILIINECMPIALQSSGGRTGLKMQCGI